MLLESLFCLSSMIMEGFVEIIGQYDLSIPQSSLAVYHLENRSGAGEWLCCAA